MESKVTLLKKADSLIKEVSAASIIAKVARDRYMAEIAPQYPAYGFEKHVGYGTALHKKALLEHGICPEHRTSFRPIREILAQNSPQTTQSPSNCPPNAPNSPTFSTPPSTSAKGQTAENNFKTKTYEIDLISTQNQQIFFTEVKYSQNIVSEGTPLVRVTPEKQRQMHYAAEKFLSTHPEYAHFQPLLAVASVSGPNYQVDAWFTLD